MKVSLSTCPKSWKVSKRSRTVDTTENISHLQDIVIRFLAFLLLHSTVAATLPKPTHLRRQRHREFTGFRLLVWHSLRLGILTSATSASSATSVDVCPSEGCDRREELGRSHGFATGAGVRSSIRAVKIRRTLAISRCPVVFTTWRCRELASCMNADSTKHRTTLRRAAAPTYSHAHCTSAFYSACAFYTIRARSS